MVSVPVNSGPPEQARAARRLSNAVVQIGGARGNVLVVDDDPTQRALLRAYLEREGYRVAEAADGAEAIAAHHDERAEVVLMDANMPGMDGFQACRRLCRLPERERPAVLVVTSSNDEQTMEQAFLAGASDFVPKPVAWTVLRQRLRRLLLERRAERHINFLAYHDALTGLPNRAHFIERLESVLDETLAADRRAALLFMDLDGFKLVNDTLGHGAGDQLLREVASRLLACLPDDAIIARLGGDEFVILLTDVVSEQQPAEMAGAMMESLTCPITVMDREFFVPASVGVAMFPQHGDDASTLMKNADTAMYRAKDAGRNNVRFYTSEMGTQMLVRMSLESNMRRALDAGEFRLHYQPQVDLQTGQLVAVEALVRWQHPQIGQVSPGQFIPLAEDTGLIHRLGAWVLETACLQAVRWYEQGRSPFRVAVNVSGKQFDDSDLVGNISRIVRRTGLDPTLLELELTENVVMRDVERSLAMIDELKALGIRISIDDFGTGYSSLGLLKRLPLDTLKIDRSFVSNVPGATDDAAIVRAIVAMAHTLRLGVVAEGVETWGQVEFLRGLGCETVQGFYISRPGPVESIGDMVTSGRALIRPATAHTHERPVVVGRERLYY